MNKFEEMKKLSGCGGGCEFIAGYPSSTAMAWKKLYDEHGNLLNSDPNRVDQDFRCRKCKAEFVVTTQRGEVKVGLVVGRIDV